LACGEARGGGRGSQLEVGGVDIGSSVGLLGEDDANLVGVVGPDLEVAANEVTGSHGGGGVDLDLALWSEGDVAGVSR